ncbi:MAG TPA: SCO1664 family protein [Acidimicrobiales bacterium]|nr:SCO1664 family protein [Acidimicrobiales bacterium]
MSRLDEATAREVLLHGTVEVHGRIQDSSNATLLVTVRLGAEELLAVYKPERGERPLWDFPPGLWRREVAAYELDQLLGTDCVPLTVARDATFGPGSLQRWVHEEGVEHYLTLHDDPSLADWFKDLAAFDVVANNTDRKSGHVLLEDGRCWAIDNGLCFHVDDKLRTVIWEFAGEPVAPRVLERLAEVAHGDVQVLKGLLDADEVEATKRRARELLAAGVLPEPDDRGGYPPWPWPII